MKKLLCVFELDYTLMYIKGPKRVNYQTFTKKPKMGAPDFKKGKYELYFRSGREDLLEIFFNQPGNDKFFDIAVWSSLSNDMTKLATQAYFGSYFNQLAFVNGTRRKNLGALDEHGALKLNRHFNEYDETNTVVISPFENTNENFKQNDLLVSSYNPETNIGFETDLEGDALPKYLLGLKQATREYKADDARYIMMKRNFKSLAQRMMNNQDQADINVRGEQRIKRSFFSAKTSSKSANLNRYESEKYLQF